MIGIGSWSQLVAIFLLSIFKYGLGLFTGINSTIGFWPSILANLVGSAIGVLLFTYFGAWMQKKYITYFNKDKKHKKFTKWNRFLIKFKKSFGLYGIAILSPVILTIPVGVILSLQITKNKKKIFVFIFASCIVWSWIFFLIDYFFGINVFKFLQKG